MSRTLRPPCGFDKHSGTENLYWYMFDKFPSQDIPDENLPILESLLSKVPEMQRDRIRLFYGIGCTQLSPADIAKLYGLKYISSIYEPMYKGISKLCAYRNTINLLFTPYYYSILWHCTEIGDCPLRIQRAPSKELVGECPYRFSELLERFEKSQTICERLSSMI